MKKIVLIILGLVAALSLSAIPSAQASLPTYGSGIITNVSGEPIKVKCKNGKWYTVRQKDQAQCANPVEWYSPHDRRLASDIDHSSRHAMYTNGWTRAGKHYPIFYKHVVMVYACADGGCKDSSPTFHPNLN
jgi:hypothetical protein